MGIDCPACGMPALPCEGECGCCGALLRAPAEAEDRLRRWEALPPEVRAEFESDHAAGRRRYLEHRAWLRRSRGIHTAMGALAVSLAMNLPIGLPSLSCLLADLLLGAMAGLALNALGGGRFLGIAIFVAAGAATVLLLPVLADLTALGRAWWVGSSLGILGLSCVGCGMGVCMELDRRDRSLMG